MTDDTQEGRKSIVGKILESRAGKAVAATGLIGAGFFVGQHYEKHNNAPAAAAMVRAENAPKKPKKDWLLNRPAIKHVLLVAGPGGTAFDEKDIEAASENFRKLGVTLTVVGDGKKSISIEEIATAAAKIDDHCTIVLQLHGEEKRGEHFIDLTGECNTPTAKLLTQVKAATKGKITDYFMTACHGGAAQEAARNILPEGSVFVDLAPANTFVAGHDIKNFLTSVHTSSMLKQSASADQMLYDFLCSDLENRHGPSITVGGTSFDLDGIFRAHVGVPLTKEEEKRVYDALSSHCDDDKLSLYIRKFGTSQNEWNFDAKEYGTAMAIAFAAADRTKEVPSRPPEKPGIPGIIPPGFEINPGFQWEDRITPPHQLDLENTPPR